MESTSWIKKNKLQFVLLLIILGVGAFLRLYKIGAYMNFLGDEGRDMIIVRRFLTEGDLMLIGPVTSIGNMYLGPLFYYLISPALLLANFSPVGPSIFVALIGVATIALVWWVSREWFSGSMAGLVAAGLYAISPVVIELSRFSWNPNIMPFFALLSIYAAWKGCWQREGKWLLVLGVSLAFAMQSHYLAALLLPVVGVLWIRGLVKSEDRNKYTLRSIWGAGVFVILMSPLMFFDFRHNYLNLRALREFVSSGESLSFSLSQSASGAVGVIGVMVERLLAAKSSYVAEWILAIITIPSLVMLLMKKNPWKNETSAYGILLIWMGVGVVGLTLVNREVFDHYMGFMFPAPFLLLGGFVQGVSDSLNGLGKAVVFVGVGALILINLKAVPLQYAPNNQLRRTEEVARKISEVTGGENYNFAVLAERNYEDAYEYFLYKMDEPVVDINPQNTAETVTSQLMVVCEKPKKDCDPTHDAKAEIAHFGWSKVEQEWEVGGVVLYKLIHAR